MFKWVTPCRMPHAAATSMEGKAPLGLDRVTHVYCDAMLNGMSAHMGHMRFQEINVLL